METYLEETVGMYKLKTWILKDESRSIKFISKEIGVSRTCVSNWLSGVNRPEYFFRVLIQIMTNGEVEVDDWLTKEEKNNIKDFLSVLETKRIEENEQFKKVG